MTMRATVMYGVGDVHVENVSDPGVIEPPFAFSDGTCVFN